MKIQTKDIYWLAGLLEGEGCFADNGPTYRDVPLIVVKMYDLDVVGRALSVLNPGGCRLPTVYRRVDRTQPFHVAKISGNRAAGWMMTLYPLMGERRQARIREVLKSWSKSSRPSRGLYRLKALTEKVGEIAA